MLVNIDGDPIWAPIPQNDLKTAVNTNWDLFEHDADQDLLPAQRQGLAEGGRREGAVGAGRHPAGELHEAAGRRELERGEGEPPGPDDQRQPGAEGVRQHAAGGADSAARRTELSGRPGRETRSSGSATPRATCSGWASKAPSTSSSRAAGSRRPTSPGRGRSPRRTCRPSSSRSRSSISARASWRRCRARRRRPRPFCSRRFRRRRASARRCRRPRSRIRAARPSSSRSRQTTVQRAVNTDKDILKVGDLYYMCFQGVWFMSTAATGPWKVTGDVPKQIYEIPVSSPSHAVTYVTVEESNNDAVVFATAAAFTGAMVAFGCVVWGTGYYYPPYYGFYGGYPYYYPHYPTYGYGASYNPWTGAYTRGAVAYGPYGGAGVGPALQPEDRHLLARRGRLRSVRRARRGAGVQPAHRRVRRDAAGLERLRQLGRDRRAARRPVGGHGARRPTTSPGVTTRATQTSGGGEAISRTGPGGTIDGRANRQRRRLRRPRRQRLPQAGRQLAEVRRRRLERRRAADAAAARSRRRTARRRQARRRRDRAASSGWDSATRRPGEPRFRRPRRGPAAHPGREQRTKQRVVEVSRQLPPERRRSARRRWWAAALTISDFTAENAEFAEIARFSSCELARSQLRSPPTPLPRAPGSSPSASCNSGRRATR